METGGWPAGPEGRRAACCYVPIHALTVRVRARRVKSGGIGGGHLLKEGWPGPYEAMSQPKRRGRRELRPRRPQWVASHGNHADRKGFRRTALIAVS